MADIHTFHKDDALDPRCDLARLRRVKEMSAGIAAIQRVLQDMTTHRALADPQPDSFNDHVAGGLINAAEHLADQIHTEVCQIEGVEN